MYYNTLSDALESVGVRDLWPWDQAVRYGETVRLKVDDGSKYGRVISVYRNDVTGRYEEPVTYQC